MDTAYLVGFFVVLAIGLIDALHSHKENVRVERLPLVTDESPKEQRRNLYEDLGAVVMIALIWPLVVAWCSRNLAVRLIRGY